MSTARLIVTLLAALVGQAACAQPPRTIDIGMFDSMRYSPSRVTVGLGEKIRFSVRNKGKVRHEIVIGTSEEIAHHRHAMQADPGMAHAAPNMAHVAPGGRAQLLWQFDSAGELEYACLLPGHYEAGMRGSILVSPATKL